MQNIPLYYAALTVLTLAVTTASKTVWANKHLSIKLPTLKTPRALQNKDRATEETEPRSLTSSDYVGGTAARAWVWVIALATIIGLMIAPAAYTAHPAALLYMSTPILLWFWYIVRHYRRSHPGYFSNAALNVIRRTFRFRARPHAKPIEDVTRRSYWRAVFPSWARLVLVEDKIIWCYIHQLLIASGMIVAAYAPAAGLLTPPAAYAVALLLALVSFTRWYRIDRARKTTINAFYSVCSDEFAYPAAARNTTLTNRGMYANASSAISVEWYELTDPEKVVAAFPITFPKTDMRKREAFEKQWEATFPSAIVKRFTWDTGGGVVNIVPANFPENVRWDGRLEGDWHYFVVGQRLDTGEWIGFSVVKNAPHILVAGETGSGKSELMFSITAQACLKGWWVAICDPKTTGWLDFTQRRRFTDEYGFQTGAAPLQPGDGRQGVIEHAVELFGIRDVISRTWEIVEHRKRVNAKYGVSNSAKLAEIEGVDPADVFPPMLLVVDEALSLFAKDKGGDDDTKERNAVREEVLGTVLRIIVEARALMVHIMLGFQRPDTAYMDGSARDNAGIRLGAGEFKEQGKKMVFDEVGAVPRLPLQVDGEPGEVVKGRGQVKMGSGQPVINVQYAWLGQGAADLDTYLPMPEIEDADAPLTNRLDDDPLEGFEGTIRIDEHGMEVTGDQGQWSKPDGTPNLADSEGYMPPLPGSVSVPMVNGQPAVGGSYSAAPAYAPAPSRAPAGVPEGGYTYNHQWDADKPYHKGTFDPLEPPFFVHPADVDAYAKKYKVPKTKVTWRDTDGQVMSAKQMQNLYVPAKGKLKYSVPVVVEPFFDAAEDDASAEGEDEFGLFFFEDEAEDEAVTDAPPAPVTDVAAAESPVAPLPPPPAPVPGVSENFDIFDTFTAPEPPAPAPMSPATDDEADSDYDYF